MSTPSSVGTEGDGDRLEVLWMDGERALYRKALVDGDETSHSVLEVRVISQPPLPASIDRLAEEYKLKDDLESTWAARPIEFIRERATLVFEDPGGEPLERHLGEAMQVEQFLRLAIKITAALDQVHRRGLVHKDLKPANILLNSAEDEVRLTGFGLASRLPRERQAPTPPEFIAGTLAYMAPEQTGRMNRTIDSRSDLYALGVTFYQMLTGVLPFTAADPVEWVHCHIARMPLAPADRLAVPTPLSAIIMKLLAKNAEERYQTAAGLGADFRRCLTEWQSRGCINPFALGAEDASDRLLIPEKLYGRESEVETLLTAFGRVVAQGTAELVLVSGYSGVGKSSVVNELHKVLVPPRGLFAGGKFDQYKRDVPYATLAEAFRSLVRQILVKSKAEVDHWRRAFLEALGPNGQLMVSVIPELEFVIGEQPPVSEMPPQEARGRFQSAFKRFLGVFARPEHPLVLFLDDLQWLDVATLELLEYLVTDPDVRHVLLVGAYRDNEVTSSHPLMRTLAGIRNVGARVQEIVLEPLDLDDVERLVADALHCDQCSAVALALLIHEKTAGNPFFVIQFLSDLVEEGMLWFDRDASGWIWDVAQISARGYSDNVAELMVGKLRRLPETTQTVLQKLACLGNAAEIATLSMVFGQSEEGIHTGLLDATRTGLVLCLEGSYAFLHDRVHEAAYSLIPQEARAETHLRIGMLMAAQVSPDVLHEEIFEIVNQLNRGTDLITSPADLERVAELNLVAGQRAKISTAYESALKYLRAGRGLLNDETWNHNHSLIFSIECLLAECELLTAAMTAAENRLSILATHANTTHELSLVTRLRLTLYTALGRSDRAIQAFIDFERGRDRDWSPHPTDEDVSRAYDQIWRVLGDRQIEDLVDLPSITDPDVLDVLDVFMEVVTPALFTDKNFLVLVICRMVHLGLEYGNCDGSCFAYVWLAVLAGSHFGDYQAGLRFATLGYDLVEKRGWHRYQARIYLSVGHLVMPWTQHVKAGRELMRRAFDAATRNGDLTYIAYSSNNLITNLLSTGDPLADVQSEAEVGLDLASKIPFGIVIAVITAQLALVRTLRGLTPTFGVFDDERFDELQFERHLSSDPVLALPECWYWIRKLQARFFGGQYPAAIRASSNARRLLWTSPSFFEVAEYHFYSALSLAAAFDSAAEGSQEDQIAAIADHQRQLAMWAVNCPENFENRAALVGAEIARIAGRDLDAMRLYEQAIRSASAHGFVHNEAVAWEVAARFYAGRGFETIAQAYLRNARHRYARWGADGMVRQLDEVYPQLKPEPRAVASTGTIGAPIEHLDLATVLKVSQAVSGEIVFQRLLDTLMRTAMAQAGAERTLLVFLQGDTYRIAAEALTSGDAVTVHLRDESADETLLPLSVLHYIVRTQESVILDDAAAQSPFVTDFYVRSRQARSVLCLPLINQAKLVGLLYFENNLAPGVFAPTRIPVLKLLASQAAISLENARLYREVAEREAKIGRLVDSNIVGTFIWKAGIRIEDGARIVESNDAFLRMVGYDREDIIAGRMSRANLTAPEWRERDAQSIVEVKKNKVVAPFEKELIRKDGNRLPVLMGYAAFDDQGREGVAFVIDLTERKRAEAETRELQTELEHANRVAAIGQLSASIGHEINQPLSGIITNAATASLWLEASPPNVPEALLALGRIERDGKRAGEISARIRALVKKAPPQNEVVDVNEVVIEIVGLTRGEAMKNGVSVETQLADGLPLLRGDRIQLQQVLLNLVMNAIEAMSVHDRGPKQLLLSTGKDDSDSVAVAVRDTGPGLDSAEAERVFQAFYTTKATGLGIGLSICRSIIEAHGGKLWARSNTPHGAVFQFSLPSNGESHNVA